MAGEIHVFNGRIITGMGRGKDLMRKYRDRLHGMLSFMPFLGTLDVELDKKFDIRKFETKRVDHILLDGKPFIELRLAPAKIIFGEKTVDCWVMRQEISPYEDNILELMSEDVLLEELGAKMFDHVKIEAVESEKDMFGRMKRSPPVIYPQRKIQAPRMAEGMGR